jgi:hypothetical protein
MSFDLKAFLILDFFISTNYCAVYSIHLFHMEQILKKAELSGIVEKAFGDLDQLGQRWMRLFL